MKTASEMNEETGDQIQLVQASRRHINSSENNNNSILRNSMSLHRSSNSSMIFQQLQQQQQQQKPTNNNSGKLSSNRNKKFMPPPLENKEGDYNDLDSEGMDPDLYPTKIPEWARSPELAQKLKLQKTADGNKIFGEMVPMEMSEIFGTRRRNKV
ncbi:hypothetical protein BDC45DRAFT_518257 [Circinella umbellata]|nr:hypothetical protein BDC45DRAFT_518257 [Circinella umbellata]